MLDCVARFRDEALVNTALLAALVEAVVTGAGWRAVVALEFV